MKKNKTYIVAEIGNNHEGNLKNAFKLIDAAKSCGVDAVKFQTYKLDNFLSNSINSKTYNRMRKFQIKFNDFLKIKKYCNKKKIDFFSTPLDLESAFFLNKIQNIFKISSGDNNYYELIDLIKSFNKPIIISTGLLNLSDITKLKNYIKKNWMKKKNFLCLMHCVSSYPAPDDQINLSVIKSFVNKYDDCIIGYSDHSMGPYASIYSVACGAKIVEKHFTLDKNFSDFRDHRISADIGEMKNIVKNIRHLEKISGYDEKRIQKSEKENLINARRSVSSKFFLKKNIYLKLKDLKMLRPGNGYVSYKKLIGKKLNKDIAINSIITKKDFK